ncbi:alpha/beta-Hydrolase [Glarea lozoyensis ATCC 20868]|uniref:Alpha/beta-Hydrolase n=1 Tax=Glarea lozoyensis (strain ATCC 20868 / MF5171) TaxID=1116229 RepID=S3E309_GLAL2|nr:alpha/beta-Hydrolase [Glarea lozoyensis ATCC 20868]EPE32798.1 alpha/beta-Hydrolase [Glarea lozoyensis ATCC 20868]
MAMEIEGVHRIGDKELFCKAWKPDEPSKAKLVFVHGFNDHTNRYHDLFSILASRGVEVHGFDQRGWGRSVTKPSERGLTGPTSQVIADVASFVRTQLPSEVPVFVMGHSMGGGEVLMLASDPAYEDVTAGVRGWILESPFIGFPKGFEPGSVTVFFGRLAGRLFPHLARQSALPPQNLTRDPKVVESLKEDTLIHDYGTLEGLAGMLDRTAALNEGRTRLNKGVRSIWCGHGTEDKGTSYEASKAWVARQTQIQDKEFKSYEGWSHQLHADLPENTHIFAKDVGDWIMARLGPDDAQLKPASRL